MHSNVIVLKSSPDCPCSMTEDNIFEDMHGVADYIQPIDIIETKDIVNCLQEAFCNLGIDINVHIDPEGDKRVMVVIQNPKNTRNKYLTNKFTHLQNVLRDSMSNIDDSLSYYKVKIAVHDENNLWICTDLFNDVGIFEVMPLDLFMDYLKYLGYNSETKGKEVILYFDKLFDYHF